MKTILVVEDDEQVLSFLNDLLSRNQFRCIPAINAEVANEILKTSAMPDALVCDLMLPGLSGLDFARILREATPAFPILFISGDSNYVLNGKKMPSLSGLRVPFLAKPFSPDSLLASVRDILSATSVGTADKVSLPMVSSAA